MWDSPIVGESFEDDLKFLVNVDGISVGEIRVCWTRTSTQSRSFCFGISSILDRF